MAKLNSSYNSGFYIPDEYNLQNYEREQREKRKQRADRDLEHRQRKQMGPRSEADALGVSDADSKRTIRQTWQVDFDTICDGCRGTIVKGTKVYANVLRLREKFLKAVNVYELTIRCPQCSVNEIVFVTDPENATYRVVAGGRRASGGFMERAAHAKEAAPEAPEAGVRAEGDQEHAERLERHQQAVLQSEAIDAAVDEAQRKMFFPAADVMASVRENHARMERERQATLAAAHRDLLSDSDAAKARAEFDQLRAEFLATHKKKSAGTPVTNTNFTAMKAPDVVAQHPVLDAALGLYANVVEAEDLLPKHDAMLAGVVPLLKAPSAPVAVAVAASPPPPSTPVSVEVGVAAAPAVAAVAAPFTKKKSSLLSALQDY